MANISYLEVFPEAKDSISSIEGVTSDDILDLIQTNENLKILDLYNKLECKNIKNKLQMLKKINNIYRTSESLNMYYEQSAEGVVGGLFKIFWETIKFIAKVIKIIIKTIVGVFWKIITFPFRAIHKDLVYKCHMHRKKHRSKESYDYSTERDEPQPHRPTKPNGPQEGSDKEIADINKFLDYTMQQYVSKVMKSDNKDIKNLFYAIFNPSKETLNLKAINTIGINICKAFDKTGSNINRFITNGNMHVNRSREDDQGVQKEGNNVAAELQEIKLFEGVDISPKNWTNEVTCSRRAVDFIVDPQNIDKVIKLTSENSNIIKDKRGIMEKNQKELDNMLAKADQNKNVEQETVNTIKRISHEIGRTNSVFMCFGDFSKTIVTCLSKFKEHKEDYKERKGGGKF
jgi:hypothetical protein